MDFLPQEKILFNNKDYDDKEENINEIDEVLVSYVFSWCECPLIVFIIFFGLFPLFLFLYLVQFLIKGYLFLMKIKK